MLKTTMLFIGLLTEVSHLNPELSAQELKEVATYIAEEPEFCSNSEIREFINRELTNITPVLLKAKKVAYQKGLRPGGVL